MRFLAFPLVVLAVLAAGCGPDNTPPTFEEFEELKLQEVGELYRMSIVMNKKAPATVADLAKAEVAAPNGLEAIRTGQIVVRLGADMPNPEREEPGDGSSDEVLAWQKAVPEQGGGVLMLDRTTRKMTAQEFQSAKKAGTGDSTPATAPAKKK